MVSSNGFPRSLAAGRHSTGCGGLLDCGAQASAPPPHTLLHLGWACDLVNQERATEGQLQAGPESEGPANSASEPVGALSSQVTVSLPRRGQTPRTPAERGAPPTCRPRVTTARQAERLG